MPFRSALSGLNAASADLRIIGNNVANVSTTGFKKSRAEFQDIFARSNLGSSQNAIGSGVRIAAVRQQFSQGNIGFTDNNLDLAISGQGFYRLNDNGVLVFSRAGAFGVDRNGYVVNSQNQRLTTFLADAAGNITGALGDLQLNTSTIAPNATTSVAATLNVDASASIPLAQVPSSTITLGGGQVLDTADSPITTANFTMVDNYGNQVTNASLRFTFVAGNDWTAELLVGGAPTVPPASATVTVGTTTSATLNWDPDGLGPQSTLPLSVDTTGLSQVTVGGAANVSASANGSVQGAFNVANASSYNHSTSLTVYDSLGTSHLATMYFRKTGTPNIWQNYTYVDGVQVDGPRVLTFSNTGTLSAIDGVPAPPSVYTTPSFNPGGGAANMTLSMDIGNVTQYGSAFSVNALTQDGYTTGRLSGIDISDVGVVLARFTNGQSQTLGQIALANFSNVQGLRQLGDTSWAESFDSGPALIGQPGSGSLGLIQSGALEGANVDLTEQLVNMITAQRNFQANAQVISTADAVTQSIINIR